MTDRAKAVAALWVSDYVPHSGQDWGRYHLRDQWPELHEALNKLAMSVSDAEELAEWDRLVGDPDELARNLSKHRSEEADRDT